MAVKSRTSVFSGTVLSAGGATQSSSIIDVSALDAPYMNLRVVNGGTLGAPVVVSVLVANDYNAGSPHLLMAYGPATVSGSLTSGGGYSGNIDLPQSISAIQVTAGGNTTNNSTIDCDIGGTSTL